MNDLQEDGERKRAAVRQQHGFIYVDQSLQAKTDGYTVQVTLGWRTPADQYNPLVTLAMPAQFAAELGEVLCATAKDATKAREDGA